MADGQETRYQQPPSYPTPAPPTSPAYPTKYETPHPHYPTAPGPVPAAAGLQYQDQLFGPCARGQHERTTHFGLCGILLAIFLFPCGLLCLLVDAEQRCARCGMRLY